MRLQERHGNSIHLPSTESIPGRNHTAMMDQDTRLDNKFDEIARLLIFATNVSEEDDDPIPEALHLLGIMYEYRLIGMDAFILNGIKKDASQLKSLFLQDKSNYALAKELYSRATELDYVESMYHYHLGLMDAYGRGVQRNSAKAVDLFRRAALEHHHAASMRYLGILSLNGYGVPVRLQCILSMPNRDTFREMQELRFYHLFLLLRTSMILDAEG